jgi:uncharacterized protein (DUF433 family)
MMNKNGEISYPHIELRAPLGDTSGITGEMSPFVIGTNIPVRRIYDWFRRGIPAETLIKRYPQLGPAKVLSALAYAHDNKELVQRDIEWAERAASATTIPPPPSSSPGSVNEGKRSN